MNGGDEPTLSHQSVAENGVTSQIAQNSIASRNSLTDPVDPNTKSNQAGTCGEIPVAEERRQHADASLEDAGGCSEGALNVEVSDDSSDSGSSSDSGDSSDDGEHSWRPISGQVSLVHELMMQGMGAKDILKQLVPSFEIDENVEDSSLWHIVVQLLTEPPKRTKLTQYNTIQDAVHLLRTSKKILVLTGAGISVSCGIPDFRSKNGIYERLHKTFPDLPDPQAMFDIHFFRKNPNPFYQFAKEIYPGHFQPSLTHKFISMLEKQDKLLRNYTQNIDTLEQVAGISRVIQCHGSFATASCCSCKHQVDCEAIRDEIENSRIPQCPLCPAEVEFPVMKPDIVFFGEGLPKHFHDHIASDKTEADLLIVIGSMLKVRPVALVPSKALVLLSFAIFLLS